MKKLTGSFSISNGRFTICIFARSAALLLLAGVFLGLPATARAAGATAQSLRDWPKRAKALNHSTDMRRSGRKVELRGEDIHEVVTVQY